MQLHQLKPAHRLKKKKRIGRGGKRGTYSGRGMKGQRARAGAKIRPEERELITKLPKLRGTSFRSLQDKPIVINVGRLEQKLPAGSVLTPGFLIKTKLVSRKAGRLPDIKILGEGIIKKPMTIKGIAVSKQAKGKIEAAGGRVLS